jgi:hypothetical protein
MVATIAGTVLSRVEFAVVATVSSLTRVPIYLAAILASR